MARSKPEYMPHDGANVAASTVRAANAGRPPSWRYAWKMSGVLTKKLGRNQSAFAASSLTYSSSSRREFRHVK